MPARPLAGRISFPLSQINRYEIPLCITTEKRRDCTRNDNEEEFLDTL